jgi:RNA polymerase sigma factor (sigma-70 family)
MTADTLAERADRELVERLLAGPDEPAFEALVRRHGPMVYRVCWRVLQQAEDAEDAFQATFLVLAQKLSTLKKHDSLASWLHGVAHRVAQDARKRTARRRAHEANASVSRLGPPDDITWKELRTVLDTELAALPEKLRSPLILCYLEGRSQEEAARHLGWSKSTLKRRLEEGREALGRRLTRKGVVWPAAVSGLLVSDCVAPAALSPNLVGATVEAAACALLGRAAAGVVSSKVVTLAQGVMKAMFMSKMKSVVATLMLGGALMSGALVFFGRGLTGLPGLAAAPVPQDDSKPPKSVSEPAGVPADRGLRVGVIREDAQVDHLAWSADSKIVAALSRNFDIIEVRDSNGENPQKVLSGRSTVKFWDSKTHKLIKSLGQEKGTNVEAIVFSPDKKHVVIAGFQEGQRPGAPGAPSAYFVRILDAETWAVKQEPDLDVTVGRPEAFAFSPDGKTLVIVGHSELAETGAWVKLWDVQSGKMKDVTKFAPAGAAANPDLIGKRPEWLQACFAFSPDSRLLAVVAVSDRSKRAKIQLYEAQTGKPKQEWDIGEWKGMAVQVAFTADSKSLVSASGPVKFWDVDTGKELRALETKGSANFEVAVSPDGRHLATSGVRKEKDKTIGETFVWNAKTGGLMRTLTWEDPSMGTSSLAFSPDGMTLAIGGLTFNVDVRVPGSEGKDRGELKLVPLGR